MSYKIAGIDVHKRMLAIVVADIGIDGEPTFERQTFSTSPDQLEALARQFAEQGIQEVVMESTAQYWKPVWEALELHWQPVCRKQAGSSAVSGSLHLAQAESNRARRGRKTDFADAERLIRRLVAQELVLSFVPSPEQRLWRTVARRKQQCVAQRARLQNQMEAFLEEAHIKLSSLVSDLLGQSGRRMLEALAAGKTDPAEIAAAADRNLRASQAQLCDGLGAARELKPVYRQLLKQSLEELHLLDKQIRELEQVLATLLSQHQDAVQRLAEVPGLGGGLGAANYCRDWAGGRHISHREGSCFVGWRLSGGQRERGRVTQHHVAERKQEYAQDSESSRPRRGKDQGQHLRSGIRAIKTRVELQGSHLGDRPSALPADVGPVEPGRTLRRARSVGKRHLQTKTRQPNDARTETHGLPSRSANGVAKCLSL